MKGEEHATIERPPNYWLFDTTATISPVLQCHMNAQNEKSALPPTPVFNLTIGDNVICQFFSSSLSLQSQQPALPAPLSAHPMPSYNLQYQMLIPPSRLPGNDMPLNQFCTTYKLSNIIHKQLLENGYQEACVLCFVTIHDLKEMKFHLGEIAALQDAVEKWSVPCTF